MIDDTAKYAMSKHRVFYDVSCKGEDSVNFRAVVKNLQGKLVEVNLGVRVADDVQVTLDTTDEEGQPCQQTKMTSPL